MTWSKVGNVLRKEFSFPDFASALAFVNEIGALAEQAGHHPDIQLGWGKVVVELSTHDAGGVTHKDTDLARKIDEIHRTGIARDTERS